MTNAFGLLTITSMADVDNSYKLLFSHKQMVRDLLLGFVKEDWVKGLDLETLERVNASYVSDDIRDRHDDIVWRVKWGAAWLYVYILIEFQSAIDRYMPLRVLVYVGLLYQDLIREKQVGPGGELPPVLPVVLYNGSRRWEEGTEVSDLIEDIPGGLSRYRPRFSFLLLDEGSYQDEELGPLRNLVSALFRLENSRDPERILEVVTSLLDWLAAPEQASLRRAFTVWFNRVFFASRGGRHKPVELRELTEVPTMLAETVAGWKEEWTREVREEALKEGQQEGLEKGLEKGRKEVLMKLLTLRFGTLSAEDVERVHSADSETVLEWTEKILTAGSREDIFGS